MVGSCRNRRLTVRSAALGTKETTDWRGAASSSHGLTSREGTHTTIFYPSNRQSTSESSTHNQKFLTYPFFRARMSIVHVVMFGFKPLATPEEVEEVSGLFD